MQHELQWRHWVHAVQQFSRLNASGLSVCPSVRPTVCRQNAHKKRDLKKLRNLQLYSLLTS